MGRQFFPLALGAIVLATALVGLYAVLQAGLPSIGNNVGNAIAVDSPALSLYAPPSDPRLNQVPYLITSQQSNGSLLVSVLKTAGVVDQYVYKTGYYTRTIGGVKQWYAFTFPNAVVDGTSWIHGEAQFTSGPLSDIAANEYVIVVVCRKYASDGQFVCGSYDAGSVQTRWTIDQFTASCTNACDGKCVDFLTDETNCGACARTCAPSQTCSAGTCVSCTPSKTCADYQGQCGTGLSNGCTDTLSCSCTSGSCSVSQGKGVCVPLLPATPPASNPPSVNQSSGTSAPPLSSALGSFRYIRIETTERGWVAWKELEVYGPSGKIAIPPTSVRASSTYDPYKTGENAPSHLVDGSSATVWNAGETNPECMLVYNYEKCTPSLRSAWVEVDLGSVQQVTKIRFQEHGASTTSETNKILAGTTSASEVIGYVNATQSAPFVQDQWLEFPMSQAGGAGTVATTGSGSSIPSTSGSQSGAGVSGTVSTAGASSPPQSGSGSSVGSFRYLKVNTVISNSWVAWGEIEVYDQSGALLKPVAVTASCTWCMYPPTDLSNAVAENVVDGNPNKIWNAGETAPGCDWRSTSTREGCGQGKQSAWIVLDLGAVTAVSKVRMYTQSQPNPANATHQILVSNGSSFSLIREFTGMIPSVTWLSYPGNDSFTPQTTAPPSAAAGSNAQASSSGRYLKIETTDKAWISWREIELYTAAGKLNVPASAVTASNTYAPSGSATSYAATNVVDGNSSTLWNAGETNLQCGTNCLSAERTAWIQFDLGSAQTITKVRLQKSAASASTVVKFYTRSSSASQLWGELRASAASPFADQKWLEFPNASTANASPSGSSGTAGETCTTVGQVQCVSAAEYQVCMIQSGVNKWQSAFCPTGTACSNGACRTSGDGSGGSLGTTPTPSGSLQAGAGSGSAGSAAGSVSADCGTNGLPKMAAAASVSCETAITCAGKTYYSRSFDGGPYIWVEATACEIPSGAAKTAAKFCTTASCGGTTRMCMRTSSGTPDWVLNAPCAQNQCSADGQCPVAIGGSAACASELGACGQSRLCGQGVRCSADGKTYYCTTNGWSVDGRDANCCNENGGVCSSQAVANADVNVSLICPSPWCYICKNGLDPATGACKLPVPCGGSCSSGTVCDAGTNRCVECINDDQCGALSSCEEFVCKNAAESIADWFSGLFS